jgi:hypothetical protein
VSNDIRLCRSFFITYGKPKALPEVMPRKGLVANPLYGFAYGNPAGLPQAGQGIAAESPVFCEAKNAPKFLKTI